MEKSKNTSGHEDELGDRYDQHYSQDMLPNFEANQRPFKVQKAGLIRSGKPDRELGLLHVHMSDLPPEMLAAVFRFLNVSDRCQVMLVCARWRDVACHPFLWQDAMARLTGLREDDQLYTNLSRRGIRSLDTCDSKVLCAAVPHFRDLTELSFYDFCVPNENSKGNIRKQRYKLKFPNKRATDYTIKVIAEHLKKLVRLNLERCFRLTDVSLQYIANGLPALKMLSLIDCIQLSDTGIGYLCGRGCHNPARIPVLEYLCLRNASNTFTDQSIQYLSEGQTSLVKLNLSSKFLSIDDGMIHVAKMDKLSKLILYNANIGTAGLAHLTKGGSKVTKLDLTNCRNLTNAGLEHLGRMTHLLHLNLSRCNISDADLELLAKFGSRIKKLDLTICWYVTDDAMRHVAKLKDLQELWLKNNNVGDEGLSHLAVAESQVAILHGNYEITNVGLRHLAKLTNLRKLKLLGPYITCEGLVHFLDATAERMAHLDLWDCSGLDCRTLLYVAQRLFRLETLQLSKNHVNDEGKAVAARNLPRLRQLFVDDKNVIDQVRSFDRLGGVGKIFA